MVYYMITYSHKCWNYYCITRLFIALKLNVNTPKVSINNLHLVICCLWSSINGERNNSTPSYSFLHCLKTI